MADKHADAYALWGEPLTESRERIRQVRAEAASHGGSSRFSVSFRSILAATKGQAGGRAERILAETKRLRSAAACARGSPLQRVRARRLLSAAQRGDVVDKRLRMVIAPTSEVPAATRPRWWARRSRWRRRWRSCAAPDGGMAVVCTLAAPNTKGQNLDSSGPFAGWVACAVVQLAGKPLADRPCAGPAPQNL